mmetsp:Transcript_29662/g.43977  ORF Transcript_29662/g.43977 Transcript_29662/m.43977 type:complete len:112 (-) Transcript_29662:284-619(-)
MLLDAHRAANKKSTLVHVLHRQLPFHDHTVTHAAGSLAFRPGDVDVADTTRQDRTEMAGLSKEATRIISIAAAAAAAATTAAVAATAVALLVLRRPRCRDEGSMCSARCSS